jgi:hypothetical protein
MPSQSLSNFDVQSRVPLGTFCTQGPQVPGAVHFCVPGLQIPSRPVEQGCEGVLDGSQVAHEPLLQVPPLEQVAPLPTHMPPTQHPPATQVLSGQHF